MDDTIRKLLYDPNENKFEPIEKNKPHKTSEVICCKCCSRWVAVRPATTLLKNLECKACGKGYVIETGEYE